MGDMAKYSQGGGSGHYRDSSFDANSLQRPENPNLNGPNMATDSKLFNSCYDAPPVTPITQVFVVPCNQSQHAGDAPASPATPTAPPAEQKHNSLIDDAVAYGGSALTGGGVLAGGHHLWNRFWSPQAKESKIGTTPGAILSTQGDLNHPETIGIQRFSGTDGTFERTTSITGNKTLAFTPAGAEPPSYNLSINPKKSEFEVLRFDQPGSISSPVERAVVSMQGKILSGDPGLVSASYRNIADGLKGCGAVELDAKVLQALNVMKDIGKIL